MSTTCLSEEIGRWPSPTTNVSARPWNCSGLGSCPSSSASSEASDQAQVDRGCRCHYLGDDRTIWQEAVAEWDAAALLQHDVGAVERRLSADTLGHAERSLVQRAARRAQQVGAPERLLQRRRLPRARFAARLLTAISAPQADEIEKMKMELLRLRFDEQVRSEKRKTAGTAIESQATRQPQALARGGDAPPGRGQRPLPAGRVRRRPVAGAPGRGDGRIPRPGRVLPPHLSHREPEGDAGGRGAPALRPGRRPGGAAPDQLRRRQDPLHAGALSPLLRHRAQRAAGHRRGHAGGGGDEAARRPARGAGRQQDLARQPGRQARRHGGAHAVGRAGLAAWRQAGLRPHPGRRRAGDQPRRRAARAVQGVRPVPDPDRRVGGLRAPAPRPGRPARRRASRPSSPSPRR